MPSNPGQTVSINEMEMYYEVSGEGEPLVWLSCAAIGEPDGLSQAILLVSIISPFISRSNPLSIAHK